jgi:ParB-like chromosome segregation protein Spo0J
MSKTQPRFPHSPLQKAMSGTSAVAKLTSGLELRAVQHVPTQQLLPSPISEQYFNEPTIGELEKLSDDIRKRGILVPLIAKLDYTLLSGHNRLAIAKELNLTHVPVQFVISSLTEDEEREFVVKDNLLRRQLSNDEKIKLYRVLFPNFDERIAIRQNVESRDNVPTSDLKPLHASEIAIVTGQKKEAVKKQLQREEQRQKRENEKNKQTQEEVAVTSADNSFEQMRAREREATKVVKGSLDELHIQLTRPDVSDDWKISTVQKILKAMEKTQKLLPSHIA